jgi:HEAT repeat protein
MQSLRTNKALIIAVSFLGPFTIITQATGDKISATQAKEMLNDYHPDRQKKALDAIAAGQVEDAEILIPQLLKMLGKPGEIEQQGSIVSAIAYLQTKGNEVIPSLINLALGSDRSDQMDSIRSLARLGPEGVKALVQVLNGENEFAQEQAAFALTVHSPTHVSVEAKRPVVKELVAALYHVDANASRHLCRGLLDLGDDAVDELSAGFASGEDQRRLMALTCLNAFGVKASKVISKLTEVLESPKESVLMRKWSAAALGVIGKESELALPTLLRCLSKENVEIQFGCVRGLGALGPAAQEAVPALIRVLEKYAEAKDLSDAQLPMEAASAIKAIGPGAADAVPTLRSMLKSKDRWFQERAIGALGAIGPAAASANDDLAQVTSEGVEDLRDSAAYALGRINPEPENSKVSVPGKFQEWFDKGRRDGREVSKKIDTPPSQANAGQTVKEKKSPSQNSISKFYTGRGVWKKPPAHQGR